MNRFGEGNRVVRVTKGTLGGNFGPDNGRELIVGLETGDVISLRPKGTRQKLTVTAEDVYRYAMLRQARLLSLENARRVKSLKAARREAASIKRQERKLFK